MSAIETGGPAFPVTAENLRGDEGMTMRDYFAANAMTGLLATNRDWTTREIAIYAYGQADAMLKAREK